MKGGFLGGLGAKKFAERQRKERRGMSKLASFCDRLIEAGWLAALGLVPLYANFFTSRGFSVAKGYLLRAIVLVMLAAWLIKRWEGRGQAPLGDPAEKGLFMLRRAQHERNIVNVINHRPVRPELRRRVNGGFSAESLGGASPRGLLAWAAVVYLFIVLLTTATSIAPGLSAMGSYTRLQGAFTMLTYGAFFFLLALNLRAREQFDRIITVLLLTSVPVALYAASQELGLDPLTYFGQRETLQWRARSTLGNHVFLGAYLIMIMPWAAARLIGAGREWLGETSETPLNIAALILAAGSILLQNLIIAAFLLYGATYPQPWWTFLPVLFSYLFLVLWTASLGSRIHPLGSVAGYSALLGLQAMALALSQARGPWLAGLAGAGLFGLLIVWRWRMRRLMAGIVGAAVVVALFVAALNLPRSPLDPLKQNPLLRRLGSLTEVESGSVRYRLNLWRAIGRVIRTHPDIGLSPDRLGQLRTIIGYGPETLGLVMEKVRADSGLGQSWTSIHDRAHNDLLDHLLESGILGLGALLLLLVVFYRVALKALWKAEGTTTQLALVALLVGVTAHLIELQFSLAITTTKLLFWTFLALTLFLAKPPTEQVSTGGPNFRWAIWAALYAIIALSSLGAKSRVVEETGFVVGFLALFPGLVVAALSLGRARGEGTARRPSAWLVAAATSVLVALLGYYGSLRPMLADTAFSLGQAPGQPNPLGTYQKAATIEPREDSYIATLGNLLAQFGIILWEENPEVRPPGGFQPTLGLARTIEHEQLRQLGSDGAFGLGEVCLQEARRLQPLNPRYAFLLAQLNHNWGLRGSEERLDLALRYYKETSDMSPNRPAVLLNWAMAHLAKKQTAAAFERIEEVRSLGYDAWLFHYTLALAYYHAGKVEPALKEAEIASRKSKSGEAQMLLKLLKEGKLPPALLPEAP
jgi:O-antigen ligase/tetratricopeptide (TPR) repeat protein